MILPVKISNWNEFFDARRNLSWLKRLLGNLPASMIFLTAEGTVLSLPVFNPTTTIAGIDPVMAIGAGTIVGSLVAAATGGWLFGCIHRWAWPDWWSMYHLKEGEWCRRVTKWRANVPPSPVQFASHDFYGEGVRSVVDYRRWLKKQRSLIASRKFNI